MAEDPKPERPDAAAFLYTRLIPVVVAAQAATAVAAVWALRSGSASLKFTWLPGDAAVPSTRQCFGTFPQAPAPPATLHSRLRSPTERQKNNCLSNTADPFLWRL